MDLTVLGTAAAEAWPAPFCVCEACREAARRGGKDLRRRANYQLGTDIHIDWGPDAYHCMLAFGIDYSPLRHLLVTHPHQDHWTPVDLLWRRRGFAKLPEESHLTVYGNALVGERLRQTVRAPLSELSMDYRRIREFEQLDLGSAIATPLPASHAPDEGAFIFLIDVGGSRVLIGHDTGWFPEATWEYLAGAEMSVALLDCTYGTADRREGHMGGQGVIDTMLCLREIGAVTDNSRIIATHFSHNCLSLHDELLRFFSPHGIECAFDGMRISI